MNEPWLDYLAARLNDWAAQGLKRELKLAAGTGVRFQFQGREVLSFATNDYLGLAAHPKVIAAAQVALQECGAGATASPLICGHRPPHQHLEQKLAAFKQSPAALVFASGYQAALATLSSIATATDTIMLDRLAHASLVDGARLSGARVRAFKHNNIEDAAALLQRERARRCIVVIESLYSMDGDIAPVAALAQLAADYGALLLVDEAHATGVLGARGRGVLEALGKMPAHVIAMGTLSKALGSQGGYLCAAQPIVDTIVHAGRAYLFSTALAPACAAAAAAALDLVDAEPQRRKHVLQLAAELNAALAEHKSAIRNPQSAMATPIVPLLVGDERHAVDLSARLLAAGIFVPAVRYPTVKKGQARLRVSLSAAHSPEDVGHLIKTLHAAQ